MFLFTALAHIASLIACVKINLAILTTSVSHFKLQDLIHADCEIVQFETKSCTTLSF